MEGPTDGPVGALVLFREGRDGTSSFVLFGNCCLLGFVERTASNDDVVLAKKVEDCVSRYAVLLGKLSGRFTASVALHDDGAGFFTQASGNSVGLQIWDTSDVISGAGLGCP